MQAPCWQSHEHRAALRGVPTAVCVCFMLPTGLAHSALELGLQVRAGAWLYMLYEHSTPPACTRHA